MPPLLAAFAFLPCRRVLSACLAEALAAGAAPPEGRASAGAESGSPRWSPAVSPRGAGSLRFRGVQAVPLACSLPACHLLAGADGVVRRPVPTPLDAGKHVPRQRRGSGRGSTRSWEMPGLQRSVACRDCGCRNAPQGAESAPAGPAFPRRGGRALSPTRPR